MYEKSDTNCCLTNQIRFQHQKVSESFQSSYFCFLVFSLVHILCIFVTNALLFLSCSISNFTPKVGEKDTQRAIRQAFNVWQTVTPLSFQVRDDYMLHTFELHIIRAANNNNFHYQSANYCRFYHFLEATVLSSVVLSD